MKSRVKPDVLHDLPPSQQERRPERRQRMLVLLQMMGVGFKVFDAVDGKKLDDAALKKLNVS